MWRKRTMRILMAMTMAMMIAILALTNVVAYADDHINLEEIKENITQSTTKLLEKEDEIVFTDIETTNEATYNVNEETVDVVFIENVVEETMPERVTRVQTLPEDDPLAIIPIEIMENGTVIYKFKDGTYTVPYNPIGKEPEISEDGYVEQITEVPQLFQQSYPKNKYGNHGTVSSHGCGITSCAMVYSYLLDRMIMPDELAETYARYNTPVGSDYALFSKSAEDFGLEVQMVWNWKDVETALNNGQVVIANVQSDSIFTTGGHYIVYYGMTEDGKVLINDPNIYNYGQWSGKALTEGFENGFDQKYCKYSFPCWIYGTKDIESLG